MQWSCLAFLACALLLAACNGSVDASDSDVALRSLVEERGLTGDPSAGSDVPSIDSPIAVLGRKLFFSKSLGGDFDSACVSCHHPALGGGDALALSIGVGAEDPDLLGPGRTHPDGELTVPRNAPTTFNIALWEESLFWDGRVENLGEQGTEIRTPDSPFGVVDVDAGDNLVAAQARFPVTSIDEMRGFDFVLDDSNAEVRSALEQRLAEDGWGPEFDVVFGSPEVTYARIAEAIGAYESSQVFVDTPWRAYVQGDDAAIDESAKRGALLFFQGTIDGGFGCADCHSGDFFTNESFMSICAPQIGRGKGDGVTETNDYGRARETGDDNDRFTFRVPTLLNVSATGPYLHSGAYDNLADVVRHHLDPVGASDRFDPTAIPLAATERFQENLDEMVDHLLISGRVIPTFSGASFDYTDEEVEAVTTFLETLTDPCVLDRECLAPWVANPETDDVDGTLLLAHDAQGNPL